MSRNNEINKNLTLYQSTCIEVNGNPSDQTQYLEDFFKKLNKNFLTDYTDLTSAYKISKDISKESIHAKKEFSKIIQVTNNPISDWGKSELYKNYEDQFKVLLEIEYRISAMDKKYNCDGLGSRPGMHEKIRQCRRKKATLRVGGFSRDQLAQSRSQIYSRYPLFNHVGLSKYLDERLRKKISNSKFNNQFKCKKGQKDSFFSESCDLARIGRSPKLERGQFGKILNKAASEARITLNDVLKRHQKTAGEIEKVLKNPKNINGAKRLRNKIFSNRELVSEYLSTQDIDKEAQNLNLNNFSCRLLKEYDANEDNTDYNSYAIDLGVILLPIGAPLIAGKFLHRIGRLSQKHGSSGKKTLKAGSFSKKFKKSILAAELTGMGLDSQNILQKFEYCQKINEKSIAVKSFKKSQEENYDQCQETLRSVTMAYSLAMVGGALGLASSFQKIDKLKNSLNTVNKGQAKVGPNEISLKQGESLKDAFLRTGKNESDLKAFQDKNSKLNDQDRISAYESLIGRKLNKNERSSVLRAHQLPGELRNIKKKELRHKSNVLRELFTEEEIRRGLDAGIFGGSKFPHEVKDVVGFQAEAGGLPVVGTISEIKGDLARLQYKDDRGQAKETMVSLNSLTGVDIRSDDSGASGAIEKALAIQRAEAGGKIAPIKRGAFGDKVVNIRGGVFSGEIVPIKKGAFAGQASPAKIVDIVNISPVTKNAPAEKIPVKKPTTRIKTLSLLGSNGPFDQFRKAYNKGAFNEESSFISFQARDGSRQFAKVKKINEDGSLQVDVPLENGDRMDQKIPFSQIALVKTNEAARDVYKNGYLSERHRTATKGKSEKGSFSGVTDEKQNAVPRGKNEDAILAIQFTGKEERLVFLTLDGMGGYGGGDLASGVFGELAERSLARGEKFEDVLINASGQLAGHPLVKKKKLKGLIDQNAGLAYAGVEIIGSRMTSFHIVDVKTIVARKKVLRSKRQIVFETADDNKLNRLKREQKELLMTHQNRLPTKKEIEDLNTSDNRRTLEKAVQVGGVKKVPQKQEVDLKKGDFVITASDGLWDNFSPEEVMEIIANAKTPDEAVKIIREKVRLKILNKEPGHKDDDFSIQVYHHEK